MKSFVYNFCYFEDLSDRDRSIDGLRGGVGGSTPPNAFALLSKSCNILAPFGKFYNSLYPLTGFFV